MASPKPLPRLEVTRVSKRVTRDRGPLSMVRCMQCREAKQKCLPNGRSWPSKCDRCEKRGLPCSEPKRAASQRLKDGGMTNVSPAYSLTSASGVGGKLDSPEIKSKIIDVMHLILYRKNIEMALCHLPKFGEEYQKTIWDFCSAHRKLRYGTYYRQLTSFKQHVESLIHETLHELDAVANLNGSRDWGVKLQLWGLEKRPCEFCGTLPDLYPTLAFNSIGYTIFKGLVYLTNPHPCYTHGTYCLGRNEASQLLRTKNIYPFSSSLGQRLSFEMLPPKARVVPYHIPGVAIAWIQTDVILTRQEFNDGSPNDLLGRTWLHQLLDVDEDRERLTQALSILKYGSKTYNCQDFLGRTPLHIACLKGHALAVQQLLQTGADATLGDDFGILPIDLAAATGSVEICQILRNHLSFRSYHAGFEKARSYALRNYHFAAACILSSDYDPPKKALTSNSNIVLVQGILLGQTSRVRAALKDADLNASIDLICTGGRQPETALTLALNQRHTVRFEIADILLDAGADLEAKTGRGETALHVCIRRCDEDGIKWLYDEGADILARDSKGRTALMIAVKKNLSNPVDQLLKLTAQSSKLSELLDATDYKGHTAWDYARWNQHLICDFVLSRWQATLETPSSDSETETIVSYVD